MQDMAEYSSQEDIGEAGQITTDERVYSTHFTTRRVGLDWPSATRVSKLTALPGGTTAQAGGSCWGGILRVGLLRAVTQQAAMTASQYGEQGRSLAMTTRLHIRPAPE